MDHQPLEDIKCPAVAALICEYEGVVVFFGARSPSFCKSMLFLKVADLLFDKCKPGIGGPVARSDLGDLRAGIAVMNDEGI